MFNPKWVFFKIRKDQVWFFRRISAFPVQALGYLLNYLVQALGYFLNYLLNYLVQALGYLLNYLDYIAWTIYLVTWGVTCTLCIPEAHEPAHSAYAGITSIGYIPRRRWPSDL